MSKESSEVPFSPKNAMLSVMEELQPNLSACSGLYVFLLLECISFSSVVTGGSPPGL